MSTDADAITDERIAGIADRMVEEGRNVTPVTIWSEVSGGSIVAIAAALDRWREARQPQIAQPQAPTLPENVAENIMSAAGRLWSAAHDEAERAASQRLGVVRQHLDATLAERGEALAEYQRMVEEVEAGRERLVALTNAQSASQEAARRLEEELVTSTHRAEAAEARVEELVQRASIEHAELESTKAALDEERAARAALGVDISRKDDEITRLTQAQRASEEAATRLETELAASTHRAESAEARVEELVQRVSVEHAELESTKAALDEERVARAALGAVISSKDDEITRLTQAQRASQEAATRLEEELATSTRRADAAEARVEELVQRASVEHAELERTRTAFDEERAARNALAAVVSNKNDEITRITHKRDEAWKEAAALGEAYRAMSDDVKRWSEESGAASSRAQAAEAQLDESRLQLAARETELDDARHALAGERQTAAARQEEASANLSELQRVVGELEEARKEISAMADAKAAAIDETARVAQEATAARERAEAAEQRAAVLEQRFTEIDAARVQELDDARNALAVERQTAAERLEEASANLSELQRVAGELEEARKEVSALADAKASAIDEAARAAQEASAARERADAAGHHAAGLAQRLAELDAARGQELDDVRNALAVERQAAAERLEEASVKFSELQRVTRELEETRKELSAMADAKAAAIDEAVRVAQETAAATERADAAEQRAIGLEQRLAELNAARIQEVQRDESAKVDEVAALRRQLSADAKAHEKAFNELRALAEQWVAHAKDLKQRLGSANEKILFVDARSTGEVALLRRLSAELERLKPDHELASRDAQQKLIGATMAERLAQKGYRYDPATAVISKVES
jgi:chromosome segregation ATPase